MTTHRKTHLRTSAALGLALLLALTMTTVACSSTQTTGDQVNDSELASKVKAKLAADPEVNPFEIDVDASDGVIRLAGVVETAEDRAEAGRLAAGTPGVVRVDNELTLGDKTVRDTVDDASIVSRVKGKLAADPDVSASNIDVDSELGVVTLSGMVKTEAAKAEAEKLATGTKGVKRVQNRLKVGNNRM